MSWLFALLLVHSEQNVLQCEQRAHATECCTTHAHIYIQGQPPTSVITDQVTAPFVSCCTAATAHVPKQLWYAADIIGCLVRMNVGMYGSSLLCSAGFGLHPQHPAQTLKSLCGLRSLFQLGVVGGQVV